MRARPWIGVTTYHREPEGRPRFQLPAAYVDAVRRAGGLPVLLAPGEAGAAEFLERLDGLVFTGGGDLDPEHFGGERHPHTYFVCRERDVFELELMRAGLERGIPTLAICRGMQVLNVAQGGALHVHVEDAVGQAVLHRASQAEPTRHPVRIAAGSRLAGLLGRAELTEVASWHHQAVSRLGRGLRAVAWAPDGTVEALELDGAPQLLAVQWHPELDVEERSPHGRLFRALVERAPGAERRTA